MSLMMVLFDGEDGATDTLRFMEGRLGTGLWSWDLDPRSGDWSRGLYGRKMEWSPGFYRLLGLEPGSVEPSFPTLESITHPDDRRLPSQVEGLLQTAAPYEREFRIVQPRGDGLCVARGEHFGFLAVPFQRQLRGVKLFLKLEIGSECVGAVGRVFRLGGDGGNVGFVGTQGDGCVGKKQNSQYDMEGAEGYSEVLRFVHVSAWAECGVRPRLSISVNRNAIARTTESVRPRPFVDTPTSGV